MLKMLSFALLVAAACGGGGGKVKIVDSGQDGSPDASAANTHNDMVDVRFTSDPARELTASPDDQPDNATALPIGTAATGTRITGVHADVDAVDEYRDRDTYLITTGPDTNELTVRLDWDDTASDHDFLVFNEVVGGGTLLPEVAAGVLVGNAAPEFQTFTVEPNKNYWVWTGTYDTLEDGSTAPTLPSTYDLSIYGANFVTTPAATCDFTEAADATNDDITAMGTPEASGLTFTNAARVICGKLDSTHFVPGMNGDPGVVDVDSYNLTVGTATSALVTLIGSGAEALSVVQFAAFDVDGNALQVGTFLSSHGVFSVDLPAAAAVFTVFALNQTATAAPINYQIKLTPDVPNTRAPKITAAADVTEAND